MVLGAPRLHATLTTGRIVSKTAAGAYAAERFPDHAQLAGRCVRWRAGEPEEFTMADGLRAAALIRAVVSTAETAAQEVAEGRLAAQPSRRTWETSARSADRWA